MYTPPQSYVMHEHVTSMAYFNAKRISLKWIENPDSLNLYQCFLSSDDTSDKVIACLI